MGSSLSLELPLKSLPKKSTSTHVSPSWFLQILLKFERDIQIRALKLQKEKFLPQIKELLCQPLFSKYPLTSGVALFVCIELTWCALVEFPNHPFIWSWIIFSSSHYCLPVVFLIKVCPCLIQRCVCHCCFLGQNDLHSLSLHQDFKSSVTSMQRKRPQSTPQVPHERTQWSHLVLETFMCLHSL